MSYTLVGSQTSPFVRRIRILLENLPYDFKELNIFETEDGLALNKINPINQVPVFLDGEQKIWDSRQIFNYINLHHKIFNMTWDDENQLTAIESAMTSGVNLLLMKRSGLPVDEPYMIVNRQKERIESVLDYLKPYVQDRALKEWDFISISLYCFLDWGVFRSLVSLEKRPECINFLNHYANKSIILKTAIPKV